nr:citryl-CoA lyase [uncultured Halomonas sp.]
MENPKLNEIQDWWNTKIIDIQPGIIRVRGYPIEQLIGSVSFPQMIWLMLRGELPSANQASLLEAALVAAVDHGPQAPSISMARMAMTCGVHINNAMASAINVLGDVHGGAGQQCMQLYHEVAELENLSASTLEAARQVVNERLSNKRMIEGFGHRFHPEDPRSGRLLRIAEDAVQKGTISGRYVTIGKAVEAALREAKGSQLIPMNIDGVTAVIYAELKFPIELARGLFIISRSVGILSHAWEQSQQGERIKGPMPPSVSYRYDGPEPRKLVENSDEQ